MLCISSLSSTGRVVSSYAGVVHGEISIVAVDVFASTVPVPVPVPPNGEGVGNPVIVVGAGVEITGSCVGYE